MATRAATATRAGSKAKASSCGATAMASTTRRRLATTTTTTAAAVAVRGSARCAAIRGDDFADAIDAFASASQSALANAHATIATSRLFEVADAAVDATGMTKEEAAAAAKAAGLQKGGWLGPITDGLESALEGIDGVLDGLHVPYSYGYSIIVLTVLVKLATFPLSKKQVESSTQMQALQPRIKELQAMYANDPERLQMEQARLYKEANFNPLAGCLPVFATLPVFIGLYRALGNAAAEGLLTDGFYWIPSLGGPTSLADRNAGSGFAWLWPFIDGQPPLGWHDTIAYLVLPVLLVGSQYVSQQIISPQPKTEDPAQQQSQAILKFLPLMIGFFSLNVPAGLTLYWFANNLITTTQTLVLRQMMPKPDEIKLPSAPKAPGDATPVRVEYVPKSQKRSGAAIPSAAVAQRPSPPKVEQVSEAVAAEFADFDDGPANVVEVIEPEIMDVPNSAPPKTNSPQNARKGPAGGSRKKRRGSR